ncbi:hypothetical protein HYFRA_00012658 [Hymenoscyphus fraxineus]|uniref:Uncharacterized protein n=1 Tax=Hymenoscyphus fraxineus TaxID=746836 RepID=A0A9N9L7H0_9HELO|nr:hypothetical protein HYFRA_00012658 [Hymenoscyphus fraxineus]
MRIPTFLLALCASATIASSSSEGAEEFIDSAIVSLQPISSSTNQEPIQQLCEIRYNPSTLSAEIVSFEQPDLDFSSSSSSLLRIGLFDPTTAKWKSSVSTTSTETFAKGYSPTIVLSLDATGGVMGVSIKSARIDAGQTRDFGPKVRLRRMGAGGKPELNRPVVLSKEGKLEEPEPEKTLLQKYWWVLLGGMMLLLTTGGPE